MTGAAASSTTCDTVLALLHSAPAPEPVADVPAIASAVLRRLHEQPSSDPAGQRALIARAYGTSIVTPQAA